MLKLYFSFEEETEIYFYRNIIIVKELFIDKCPLKLLYLLLTTVRNFIKN